MAAVAVLVPAVFAWWESRITYPMLHLHFLRDRRFTGAVAGAVLITFGMGGALFLLTRHLQFVLGYGALEAGCARRRSRSPSWCSTSAACRPSGRRARHAGFPRARLMLMSGGLVSIATLAPHAHSGTLLGLLLIGAGCAVANPAMAHATMSAIPPREGESVRQRHGRGVRQWAGGGVAVLGAELNSRCAGRRRRTRG